MPLRLLPAGIGSISTLASMLTFMRSARLGCSMPPTRQRMAPGGTLIALVPQGRALFGSLDRTLGHKRRYSRRQLRELLAAGGFHVEQTRQLNKIGAPPWWLFSRALRRRQINKLTLKIFDKTVWFWRLIDPLLPWPGLSLVAVARKDTGARGGGSS